MQADGRIAPPGLWRLRRECASDADSLAQGGMVIEDGRPDQELVLIASVPLTGKSWVPFAEGEVIVIKDGKTSMTHASPTQLLSAAQD